MDSKSSTALAWSSSKNASQAYSSSEIPGDAKLAEKSFATDINPSVQNLSVVGLRILLLTGLTCH